VIDQIRRFLAQEERVPTYEELRLSARNHYVRSQFNLAVIEMNVALETMVASFLYSKMSQGGMDPEKIDTRMKKYLRSFSAHQLLDEALREIDGRSLKDDPSLWQKLDRARLVRKNAESRQIDGILRSC